MEAICRELPPGCVSWDDERGEVTVLQLLLVVSLIRQPCHQSRRRMIDLAAPAQQRQEDGPGPVREGLVRKKKKKKKRCVRNMCGLAHSCKCVGVLAVVQIGRHF